MKKAKLVLIGLFLLLAVISCSSEPETTTLRVEMDKGKRTVAPSQGNMEIYGYRIIPVNAEGKEQTERYTYYSYINLDGLTVGEWTIKVYGFSKDRMDLAYGESKVNLVRGKNTTKIEVKELIGTGELDLSLLWDIAQFPTAYRIETHMCTQSGEDVPAEATTPSEGSSSLHISNLKAGSYILQCYLVDKENTKLSGFTEAIRIANNVTSSATIRFSDPAEAPSTDVLLSDLTSTPVELKINGLETLVEATKAFTVNVSVLSQNLTASQLQIKWYLDGTPIGEGELCTLKHGATEGLHRLDVLAYTSDNGSVGSTTFTFQAASSSEPGAPYQRNILQEGSLYKMGEDTVTRFLPDGRLVIVSNCHRTITLVDISGATPKLVKEFSFEELNITGTVADFASTGEEGENNYSVIFLVNDGYHPKILNIIVSRDQMTYSDKAENLDPTEESNPATDLISLVPVDKLFIATIQSRDKARMGYIYINQNPNHGEIIHRNDWFILDPKMEYGYSGFKNMASLPDTGYTIITSGQRSKILRCVMQASGKASVSESMMWTSWNDYMESYRKGKSKAEFNDGHDCGFLTPDAQYAYVFSTEGIHYYKDQRTKGEEYQEYHVENLTERSIGDIRMCPDTEYGYLIDNTNHRLVTLRPILDGEKGGYVLMEGDWIELPETSNYDRIEINTSGSLLALYNSTNADSITTIKAAR